MSGVDKWTVAVIAAWLREQDGHGEWREAADAIDAEFWEGALDAQPDQFLTERNEILRERVAKLEKALSLLQSYGCPLCNGDCGSANPPVLACPMRLAP